MRRRSRNAVSVGQAVLLKASEAGGACRRRASSGGFLRRGAVGSAATLARRGGLAAALLSLALFGCATWKEKEASITGTVTCRQLIPIPTNAVVEVRLIERSGGQATLAECKMPAPRQWPIPFVLKCDLKRLAAGQQCAVQGSILVEGKPWMVTDTVNHFMEWGRIAHAEVFLQPTR